MKKKYCITILIFLIVTMFSFSIVKAEEVSKEVSDREMAIACSLSYAPLKKGKKMSENFDIGKFKLLSKTVNYFNSKVNLHDYGTIKEMDDWIVDDYRNKEISEKSMAAFILKRDNNLMIVFRGTDTEIFTDIAYGLTNYHNQEKYAKKYVLNALEKYGNKEESYNIYVTGHSLGGYLAQIAGAEISKNIDKYENLKLDRIVDFNGIGINFLTQLGEKYNYGNQKETIEILKKLGEEGRLIEYHTYGDLVSALGVHYGEMRMLYPSIDSIDYHRTNYKVLKTFGSKLLKIAEDYDIFNAFKTDLKGVQSFYNVNNIVAYLNLTHETDTFASIETEKSINAPTVKIVQAKNTTVGSLLKFFMEQESKEELKITKSETIQALTSYASAKKYVWEVSDNKEDWTVIKTSEIGDGKPTNRLDINIKDLQEGETKYYRVTAYYDDNYVSNKYYYNEDKQEYEYREEEGKSKKEESKTIEAVIKVTRPKESNNVINKLKSLINITTKKENTSIFSKLKNLILKRK